jgi:hypothetical protein
MDVRELIFRGDPEGATKLYACGKCGKCYSPASVGVQNAIDMAEKCCAPKAYTCKVCGVEVPSYRTMCERHAEQARLRKAAQIEEKDWTDPVHLDGAPGGWGEGYFADTGELREDWVDANWIETGPQLPPPAYCWPCTASPLRLDPGRLLEQAVDDMHEDAQDQIVDADGLCEFIEAWNAKQTCVTWYPDHSRVVVLDRERFEELLKDA